MWDVWILLSRWIHVIIVIMWIHIFRWIHIFMWIHTIRWICHYVNSNNQMSSCCCVISYNQMNSCHYVNSYNQMIHFIIYKDWYIVWIHALLAQFPICGCISFFSPLAQWRWQNSHVHLWTCTDAPWGMQGRFVCTSPALLATPLFDGGSRCQGSWIAASDIAWIHVAAWMQASLQRKANKSVGCLCWTTWQLPQVVLGSLLEICFCKVGIVKALLSDNIIPFGKTNVLETLTYKMNSGRPSSVSARKCLGSNCAWPSATCLVISRWPCCVPSIWHFKRLICLQSSLGGNSDFWFQFLGPSLEAGFQFRFQFRRFRSEYVFKFCSWKIEKLEFRFWNLEFQKKNRRRNSIHFISYKTSIIIGQQVDITMLNYMDIGTIPGMQSNLLANSTSTQHE